MAASPADPSGYPRSALKSGAPRADDLLMVFDVLALGLFAGGAYAFWQESRRARTALPPDDLPPAAARTPMPRHARLNGYVAQGLDSIDDYLAGDNDRDRDQPA